VSRGVELFNEIDPVIEISIGFTSDERSVVVILPDVCATVEIRVNAYFSGLAVIVVLLPDIRSTVAIAIFCADVPAIPPLRHGCDNHAEKHAPTGDALDPQTLHLPSQTSRTLSD
jgi:hypothetical protein